MKDTDIERIVIIEDENIKGLRRWFYNIFRATGEPNSLTFTQTPHTQSRFTMSWVCVVGSDSYQSSCSPHSMLSLQMQLEHFCWRDWNGHPHWMTLLCRDATYRLTVSHWHLMLFEWLDHKCGHLASGFLQWPWCSTGANGAGVAAHWNVYRTTCRQIT